MASPAPTSSETTARPHVEIAHVLFIDIVSYSTLLINEQQRLQQELNHVVRTTEQFRAAEAEGKLTRLPTGDGMALVFFTTPEAPVQCALEISEALRSYPRLKLRMGVHSGPISSTTDVNDRSNIAGAAINIAERIMSCGDAGHILLSKRVAEDLGQYAEWQGCLHDLGEVDVKHGVKLAVVNLYTDKLGNPEVPEKIKEARVGGSGLASARSAPSAVGGFFEEVQRRKVYRVAVAYIVVAGGLIQLASAVFPAWELPSWALRLVIVLLLTGFPIGLILAWAFDVTPQGIRATPPASLATPHRRGRRNLMILLAGGVLISALAGLFVLPRASARKLDKSIAVLPFENFSDSKENAFFADGIQDDILTNLAKIGDLKVISRTSVMPYRGKQANAREIGKALGVSAILEGSVRKDGNRVRVNVQLINANNDEHIWAEDYDRDLTDMFAIQTDLAQNIAKELQAKLSPAEKEQITRKPTENGEAYVAFVQGLNLFLNGYENVDKLKKAEELFERAIQLDPKFALALARYSQLESWIVHSFERTPARAEKARNMAERALQLQPDLPEAHLARGFSYYYGDFDYDNAEKEFAIAQRGLPNDSEVFLSAAAIQRRRGKWPESTANLIKAVTLDPNSSWPLQNLVFNYEMTRDYTKANETVDRALKIDPNSYSLWELKCYLAILEKGDFSTVERILAMFDSQPKDADTGGKIAIARVNLLMFQRKFPEALRAAEQLKDNASGWNSTGHSKDALIGIAKDAMRDKQGARAAFLKAKDIASKAVAETPNVAGLHAQLGMILASLGDRDAALKEAKQATDLLPESKDAFEGPSMTENLAAVYAILGDADSAIDILDGLLSRPSAVTVETLKLNPVWDPIRNNPRFAELLSKHGAKI